MANIVQRWRRVMAVGCSHGDLADRRICQQVLQFRKDFAPEVRFHLGDIVDTAAFRSGAKGTPDEGRDPAADHRFGVEFLKQLEPTHIAWGNHDVRLLDLSRSPSGIVAYAASTLWNALVQTASDLHAQTVPYDFERGWFDVGGTFWGHGYWYNMLATRDYAEYLGAPVVIAHLHRPEMMHGRTRRWAPAYCVGTLADIPMMEYARRRRATALWGHGCVFGEISDKESVLWLAASEHGTPLRFPSGMNGQPPGPPCDTKSPAPRVPRGAKQRRS